MADFALRGKIGLDARDFKKGASDASAAVGDLSDDIEELPATAKSSGSDAGGMLSSGLVKGFAAAGGVALIGNALNDAMNIEAGVDRVQGQFALTAEEAERYGEMGGDLYASAWGESATDATESIAKVGVKLQDVGDIADEELAGITTNALAVADVFGQDFDAVIRSTGQLLKNDLVDDAEEALDLVTVAFQEGGDSAGDLLDTIDEYSQHWAVMGLDGDEALGLIVEGFQQGFRDGDKLADLIKEFGIRALTDQAVAGFDALGLHGEQMRDQFGQGGESARAAFGEVVDALAAVEDPIERNRVAVEIFGTQWEDLGPKAIDVLSTLGDGLGDVEGAATDMAETVSDNTAKSFEEMKRRGLAAIAELAAEALPVLESIAAATEGDTKGFWDNIVDIPLFSDFGDAFSDVWDQGVWGDGMTELDETLADINKSVTSASYSMDGYGEQAVIAAAATAAFDDAVDGADAASFDLTMQTEDLSDAINEEEVAATDADSAIADLNRSLDNLLGISMSVEEAQWRLEDAITEHAAAANDGALAELALADQSGLTADEITALEATARTGAQATNEMEKAALANARALTDAEIATREAKGEVIDATAEQDIYKRKLGEVADEYDGPLKTALDGHIQTLNSIPANKITKIMAESDLSRAEATLASWINRPRSMRIDTYVVTPRGSDTYRADGGPVTAGAPYIVGEEGPEWFVPASSGTILPNGTNPGMSVPAGQPGRPSTRSVSSASPTPEVRVYIGESELVGAVSSVIVARDNYMEGVR